jgi:DNA-binding transcriptional regulator YhcF (GntR family)
MLLRIDTSGDLPLYRQIAGGVRRAVRDGDVDVGDRLPAARELARSLDVNMHTVLRAYRELADDGVIELRRGRGAVVRRGAQGAAPLRRRVADLAQEAKRRGVSAAEVVEMIGEEFS